jgi:toxin YoeB
MVWKMNYRVIFEKKAEKDIDFISISGNKSVINKLEKILLELESHPKTGIGNPETQT